VRLAAALMLVASTTVLAQPASRLALRPVAFLAEHLYAGPLGEPRGVAVDPVSGEVWVADTRHHVFALFTPEGIPLFTTDANEQVREPSRLVVDERGQLLVLDRDRSQIKVLSYRGEYRGTLELPGLPESPSIGALARDVEGNLYVGEDTSGQVFVYGPDLRLRRRFGDRGGEEGQFQSIAGIAADSKIIVVVDHQVIPVQVFDHRGNFLRAWGAHDIGVQNFSLPEAVALDGNGHVIVIDALRQEIKYFDRDGNFVTRFGGLGNRPGQVSYPVDIALDRKGRLFVAERGNARVQAFEPVADPSPPR